MRDGFAGLDLNGGVDRCVRIEWPTRASLHETRIDRGIVINPADSTVPFLVGRAAKMSPVARGWSRPAWAAKAGERHQVADLMARLREDNARRGANDTDMVAAHIRHLVGAAGQVGIVVSDDFGPGAQTRLLDASQRANRFEPKRGWTGWAAFPVWRSVATVFSWASGIDSDHLSRIRGRRVLVISLLADRLSIAPLEIDRDQACGETLVTPVRQTKGKSGPIDYTPSFAEIELVERIFDAQVREQVEAVGQEGELLRTGALSLVFQRKDGTWFENTQWPTINEEMREQLQECARADIRFLREEVRAGDIVLIETPESDRGIRNVTWLSWYAQKIRAFTGISSSDVYELPPEAAARGACEYLARIANGLPTYFDHIYRIEIAALNDDGESHHFIAFFPEVTRVSGNKPFEQRLDGRFAVQPGSQSLSFHLWRQDDPDHIRSSKTELDTRPAELVSITLAVTQWPVSGYARIEVLPGIDQALGARRIVLNWERMEIAEKTRDQLLAELDRNVSRAYPKCAPTVTHAVAWEQTDIRRVMANYLAAPARSDDSKRLLGEIRKTIQNPRAYAVKIDHPVYIFDSDGKIPDDITLDRFGDPNGLVEAVRQKITSDIEVMGGAARWRASDIPSEMSDLLLAGLWMYASVPKICLAYLRDVFSWRANIGQRTESIGRAVSTDQDIKIALDWLVKRLRQKSANPQTRTKITRELKAVSLILQYRENAYRYLDDRSAYEVARLAVENMELQLKPAGTRGRLPALTFKFLWSGAAFLVALRVRKMNPDFLAPTVTRAVQRSIPVTLSGLSPCRNMVDKSSARTDWWIPARGDLRNYAWQPIHREVALRSFDRLIGLLSEIPDPRRREGKALGCPTFCCSRSSPWSPAAIPIVPSKPSSRCTAG